MDCWTRLSEWAGMPVPMPDILPAPALPPAAPAFRLPAVAANHGWLNSGGAPAREGMAVANRAGRQMPASSAARRDTARTGAALVLTETRSLDSKRHGPIGWNGVQPPNTRLNAASIEDAAECGWFDDAMVTFQRMVYLQAAL